MPLEISKAHLLTLIMPAQELAYEIVNLLQVSIAMIELPAEKTREECEIETENTFQNTVTKEPVKVP
jgi:two-component sensor histidine kinase